jgi:hypothetical protein
VAKLIPVFPPDMSSMAYDPQPESTEPEIRETGKHEDARPLELLNTNDDHATSPLTTILDMSARTVQIWSVLYMPFAIPSMVSDQSTTLSGLMTRGRWSAGLD